MTKLLESAIDAARRLTPAEQDEIAHAILALTASEQHPVTLDDAEQQAIARSKAAAEAGDFATDAEVAAVWAKHRL